MARLFRIASLIFVLLLEGLGNAMAVPQPVEMTAATAVSMQEAAMPCHEHRESKPVMPCCQSADGCQCGMSCVASTSPLVVAAFSLLLPSASVPQALGVPREPVPAHRSQLLRPPASSRS